MEKLATQIQELGEDLKQKEQREQECASQLTEKVKMAVGASPLPEEQGFNLDDYELGPHAQGPLIA
eukprot:1996509-Prorocentrum_lima.AAC.1